MPDSAAGKQARCPSCDQIMAVPSAAPPVLSSQEASATSDTNPYAAPQAVEDGATSGPKHPLIDGRLDPGLTLTIGWQRFAPFWGILIVAWLIQIVIAIGMSVITSPVLNIPFNNRITFIGTLFLLSVMQSSISVFLQQGHIALSLAACRGQTVNLGLLFSQGRSFLPAFLINFVVFLLPSIAIQSLHLDQVVISILYIIYATILLPLTLAFWPVYHLLVDHDISAVEALRRAEKATRGNRWMSFVLMLLTFLVFFLGMLALCVGVIVAAPLVGLMYAVGYLMITSQPIYGYN